MQEARSPVYARLFVHLASEEEPSVPRRGTEGRMRGLRYHVRPQRPLTPPQLGGLFQLPGVRHRTHRIEVPWHLWGVVEATLSQWSVPYKKEVVTHGREIRPAFPDGCPDPFSYVPGLREEARSAATEFQQEALSLFGRLRGGVAAWACGSGKTLEGIAFSLAFPQERALVITPGGTTGQWGQQFARWTHVTPHLITTGSHYNVRATKQPKPEVLIGVEAGGLQLIRQNRARALLRGQEDEALRWHNLLLVLGGRFYSADRLSPWEKKKARRLVKKELASFTLRPRESLPDWEVVSEDRELVGRFWDKQKAREEQARQNAAVPIPEGPGVVVVGWPLLTKKLDALLHWGPSVVVVDESHRAKGTKRWVRHIDPDTGEATYTRLGNVSSSAQAIAQQAAAVLLLTATVQPDRTRDLWGQMDLYDPFGFGSFHDFSVRYCDGHQGEHGWDSRGSSNEAELAWRIRHFTHQVTRERSHKGLPPLTREVFTLSLSDLSSAKDALGDTEMGAFGKGIKSKVAAEIALAAEMKKDWVASRVAAYLAEGGKVVALTVLKSSARRLWLAVQSRCRSLGGKTAKAAIWLAHGEHTPTERLATVGQYADHEGPCCIIGTISALGEAYDGMQNTDRAIAVGLPWNHGAVEQMEGRFSRHGSRRSVVIEYPIAAGTVDEKIRQLVLDKLDAAVRILPNKPLEEVGDDLRQTGQEDELLDELANLLLAGFEDSNDSEGWEDDDD